MPTGEEQGNRCCRDADLKQELMATEEIRRQLAVQKKRYPLMNEEDIVKFVFQGMLGVGHLITDQNMATERLKAEMDRLEADKKEPLIEEISTEWVRMNLRRAKAEGMKIEDLARYLMRSAEGGALSFSRQDVYNFCVKMDPREVMRKAAVKVLDENWLPSHSEAYRAAYKPAYRVLCRDYQKHINQHIGCSAGEQGDGSFVLFSFTGSIGIDIIFPVM